jgi:hypothetical protein
MSLAAPVLMVFWKDAAGLCAVVSQMGESQSALDTDKYTVLGNSQTPLI